MRTFDLPELVYDAQMQISNPSCEFVQTSKKSFLGATLNHVETSHSNVKLVQHTERLHTVSKLNSKLKLLTPTKMSLLWQNNQLYFFMSTLNKDWRNCIIIWNNPIILYSHHRYDVHTWFGWVFGVIKDQYITGWSFGSNDAGVLRHVAGPVHFSFMINLNLNLNLATHWSEATKLWKQTGYSS